MTMTNGGAFRSWAIVEQMGHKTIACFVCEVQIAGVPMLRLDVPDGDKPIAEPKATQFIHPNTLYALTPTAEPLVRKVAARTQMAPAATWGLGALPAGRGDDDLDDLEPEDEQTDEKVVDELLLEHGLDGVLDLLIQNYCDVADPDSDRYTAILQEAKDLVDQDGRWPDSTTRADKVDQRHEEAMEERPPVLVESESSGDPSGLQEAAVGSGPGPHDIEF